MRTCGGCHLSVTIGSASTSCRSSALRSAISTLTGKQGCCSGLAGLGADYGPVRIRPALSGTDYFDAEDLDEGRGYYFFAGTQGRVVGRDIFLGGNSFRTSPSVSKKNSRRRRAGGILGPVVEIVAARHKRRAVHRGISRAANPRRRRSALPGSIRPSRR
jgi:Uncharacterized protein conserved in bacteria (DUF2219)